MSRYTFESVEFKSQPSVNAFITSINFSAYHWHYEYELLMVLQGQVTARLESEDYQLKAGDFILFNARTLHSIVSEEGDNICGLIQLDPQLFHMDPDDTSQLRFYLNSAEPEDEPEGGFDQFRRRAARILLCTLEENDLNFFRTRAEVCGFVADLMEKADYEISVKSGDSADSPENMMEMIEFVRENLTNPDLQNEMQKRFGVSEKTLYRYFKSTLGISPRKFIEEMKVQKARKMLQNSDYDMNFIIDSCGFGSEKSFYRIFKNAVGQTPGSYRRKINGTVDTDDTIQGYLDYEPYEAEAILKKYVR